MLPATIRATLLATAALLNLAACEARGPEPDPNRSTAVAASSSATAAAPTCAEEQITIGRARRHDVVTHVSPVQVVTASAGGLLDAPLRLARPYTAQVTADGPVPRDRVYERFAAVVDVDLLPPLGEAFTPDEAPLTTQGSGRLVRYEGVDAVDAAFTYRCGAAVIRGVVMSWRIPISGLLDCDLRQQSSGPPAAKQAASLACNG